MPPTQTGQAYRLAPNRWGLRYYDRDGARRRKSPIPSKSAALTHYRNHIEPQLRGEPAPLPELTLSGLIDVYLERHAASVRPRTILTLRERLAYAERAFGAVPLGEVERMSGEIVGWQAQLPKRSSDWANDRVARAFGPLLGHGDGRTDRPTKYETPQLQSLPGSGSDGTRTRDLRRDRPAL